MSIIDELPPGRQKVDTLLVNFAGVFLNRVQRELNAHRPVQRTGATEM